MKMDPEIKIKIFKNILISLLIYSAPVFLMFLSFYYSGEKPWEEKKKTQAEAKNEAKVTETDND